jgi:hypothetical protein
MKQALRFFILSLATLIPLTARCADSTPAVAIFQESLGLAHPGADSSHRLLVEIWPDGRIVWSRDQQRGGGPLLSARLEPRNVQALLDRLDRQDVFDAKSFRHSWVGPDSTFTTISLQSAARHTRLESWHEEFERQPNLVALSSGVTSLGGRTREEALKSDTKEYRQFRRVWADARSAIAALLPKQGDAYSSDPFIPPN